MVQRSLLRLLAVLAGCTFAATVSAAGSLTIVQESVSDDLGEWVLQVPAGGTIYSYNHERERVLQNPAAGSYGITVHPPAGAETSITVSRSGASTATTRGTAASFDLPADATARVTIGYSYNGVVRVESNVPGSSFELTAGGGFRMTGTTPATLENMPPLAYVVNFGLVSGCGTPKPAKRSLGANLTVTFTGEYLCSLSSSARSSSRSSARSSAASASSREARGGLRLVHDLSQAEVLPGGSVRVTLGARNIGSTTLRDITVAETFDAGILSAQEIRDGGTRTGNGAISWEIDQILAGQTWSTTFVVTADARASRGTAITLTARASGDALDATPLSHLVASATLGIAELPATGMPADAMFLGLTGLLAAAPLIRFRKR